MSEIKNVDTCRMALNHLMPLHFKGLTKVYCTTNSMHSCFNVLHVTYRDLSQFFFLHVFLVMFLCLYYFVPLHCIVGLVVLFSMC